MYIWNPGVNNRSFVNFLSNSIVLRNERNKDIRDSPPFRVDSKVKVE